MGKIAVIYRLHDNRFGVLFRGKARKVVGPKNGLKKEGNFWDHQDYFISSGRNSQLLNPKGFGLALL